MRDEIVGKSLERLRTLLPSLGGECRPIVLVGEQGTGKSLYAGHIHAFRPESPLPLQWLNFSLLSHRDRRIGLFGAEPPELTTTKRSILELPTTVLLKHVDFAELYLQDRLAESIEIMRFCRMGSAKPLPISSRLIFTLRQPVRLLERSGRLSPRLARILTACRRVRIPPLRERTGDIPALVRHYLKIFTASGTAPAGLPGIDARGNLDPVLARFFRRQTYRDNVRDLIALVRGLVVGPYGEAACDGARTEILKLLTALERGGELSLPEALDRVERSVLQKAAGVCGGRRTEIARRLGLTERDVRRKLGGAG